MVTCTTPPFRAAVRLNSGVRPTMNHPLHASDFRCFDPKLVEILPGREIEAAHFAASAHTRDECDGVFINGAEITNWGFLEITKDLPRYIFNCPSSSLSKNFNLLSNARSIKLVGHSFPVDLTQTPQLEDLCLQWRKGTSGLDALSHLQVLNLDQVGPSIDSAPMFPSSLKYLDLAYYSLDKLNSREPLNNLETLVVFSARQLNKLPTFKSLSRLSLSHASEFFSYASIPSTVSTLDLTKCPEIKNWSVLKHLTLQSFDSRSTKLPATPCPYPRAPPNR